jgi:hypothetical protein
LKKAYKADDIPQEVRMRSKLVCFFVLLLVVGGCQSEQKPAEAPAQSPAAATSSPAAASPATAPAASAAAAATPGPQGKPANVAATKAPPAPAASPAAAATPVPQGKPANVAATKAPPAPATPPAKPLKLADSPMGVVTFDHSKHKLECKTCHHESRPQKPATAAQQACRDCHTKPPQAGMTTVRQAAFHNPSATAGTCIDCHKQKGGAAPTTCKQCHVKS